MANEVTGIGTKFYRKNPSTSEYEVIGSITGISGPSKSRETVDVTTFDSEDGYREFIGSLRDAGEMSLTMNFVPATYITMNGDFETETKRSYRIVLGDSTSFALEFDGLITSLPLEVPLDDKITADISIKISGKVTVTSVDVVDSVTAISDIPVANGTQLADVRMPETVSVTFEDATTATPAVVWDAGSPIYDGDTAGIYTFTGTITMAAGQSNPEGLQATVDVVVDEA